MLAGWSLTGKPGRGTVREETEGAAWHAALPFAERAAGRLTSPPAGTPGSVSLIVNFPGDAGLVTILDPSEVELSLDGLLRVAADALHLSATRQQALAAASILVTGDTGNNLRPGRPAEVFDLACRYARGEHDGSAMDDMFNADHPLSSWRINMGDASLAADGLCLAARACRTDTERLTVLGLAAEIVRDRPGEAALNGVATAISALPSTDGGPVTLSIPALAASPSESMRAVGAMHWAVDFGPAVAQCGIADMGNAFARDPSPVVRHSLASQLAIVAARSGLSDAATAACTVLRDDPRASIRKETRDAFATAKES